MKNIFNPVSMTIVGSILSLIINTSLNHVNVGVLKVYYQISEGYYMTDLPGNICTPASNNPCSIIYIIYPEIQTFSIDNMPEGLHINSLGNGIVIM